MSTHARSVIGASLENRPAAGLLTSPLLPKRPRFLRELAVLQLEDRMLVDGLKRLHVFEGKEAQGLLSTLIRLMNGTRTLDQIESALPEVPASQIAEAILFLREWRLVEDEAITPTLDLPPNPETLAFFRRYAGITGVNRNGMEAWEKLQNSSVAIFMSGNLQPHIELLKTALLTAGVAQVSIIDRKHLSRLNCQAGRFPLIVSIASGDEDFEWHAKLDDWCFQHQLSWLRAILAPNGSYAQLGPLFNSRENSCYRCFARMHSQPGAFLNRTVTPAQIQLFHSLIAAETLCLLSHIGDPLRGKDFQHYSLPEWIQQTFSWARVPGCSRCLPISTEIAPPNPGLQKPVHLDIAFVFESFLAQESRLVLSRREQQQVSRPRLPANRQYPRFPNCAQYSLSNFIPELDSGALDILERSTLVSAQAVTADRLATILLMTAGIRTPQTSQKAVQRWSTTGGNLGSVQLFVAVRSVTGLGPGFYFYQPGEHTLAHFQRRSGALAVEDFMKRVIAGDTRNLPEAMVLFTGAFGRVSRKYGVFAYRLINMDAGVALSQLHLVAATLGIHSQIASRCADDLIADQLNLDPALEQVTAVVSLSRKPASATTSNVPEMPGLPPSAKVPENFRGIRLPAISQVLFRESRTREKHLHEGTFAVAPELLKIDLPRDSAIPLPPPGQGGRPVGNILTERVSIRQFSQEHVPLEQLSAMLHCALLGDRSDWPSENSAGRGLHLLVLAWRIHGLAPGVYEYINQQHALAALPVAASVRNATELFVQSEFAAAPLTVWISGNLAAACAAYGAFGHRQLLMRAGAAAHRLWMAALAHGLGGTVVGGIISGAARRLLDLDGYRTAGLVAFVGGYPVNGRGLRSVHNTVNSETMLSSESDWPAASLENTEIESESHE